MKELGLLEGVSAAYICKLFKSNDLPVRKRKYSLNERAFFKITPESCYWAGFIAADGSVYHKRRLEIGLKQSDVGHLRKFCKFMRCKKPIEIRHKTKSVRVCFCSRPVVEDLYSNFNIIENKSLRLLPPNNIKEDFKKDFIRGYVDGDGCICWTNNRLEFSIVGTKALLSYINCTLEKQLNISCPIPYKVGNIYRIVFYSKKAKKVLDYLYLGSSIFLDRKYEMFLRHR